MSKISQIRKAYTLNTISHSLGYCPITGICLSIEIPSLPREFLLTYKNPLADFKNAKALISLSYQQIGKTTERILAGCLLSILMHYELIEDKLSSVERNEILSQYPSFSLYETAKIILSYSDERIAGFPRLSLAEAIPHHIPTFLKTYLSSCINSGSYFHREDTIEVIRTTKTLKAKKAKEITKELRADIKTYVLGILAKEVVSTKLSTILKIMQQGNNFLTMSSDIKAKVIEKLDSFECHEALCLSNLISDLMEKTEEQEIESKKEFSTVSYGTRKTIKEILEEKRKQKASASPLFLPQEQEETESLNLEDYEDEDSDEDFQEDNSDEF